MEIIAFTSTIPVEAVYAAGGKPVDIDNLFVMAENSAACVADAKMQGFPDTTCAWICGLYGSVMAHDINTVVGVTGGDCSETLALMEILKLKGRRIIPFGYPHSRDKAALRDEIMRFCTDLGTTLEEAQKWKDRLDRIRARVAYADELLWKENRGTGNDVRLLALSCTDFEGDPDAYALKVDRAIGLQEQEPAHKDLLRIGVCGVPPIIIDLYNYIEKDGARVVYSEVERQFSIPYAGLMEDSYQKYTYPYGIFARLDDINKAVEERRLDGIIHYVQSFCFRSIEDIALKASVRVPVLTLLGDLPSKVTETMEIRIEAFIDMLMRRKKRG